MFLKERFQLFIHYFNFFSNKNDFSNSFFSLWCIEAIIQINFHQPNCQRHHSLHCVRVRVCTRTQTCTHTHTHEVVPPRLRASELFRLEGGMASSRSFFISLSAVCVLLCFCGGTSTSVSKRANQDRCAFKVKHHHTAFVFPKFVLFRQHFIQAVASSAPVCFCFLFNTFTLGAVFLLFFFSLSNVLNSNFCIFFVLLIRLLNFCRIYQAAYLSHLRQKHDFIFQHVG